MTLIDHEEIGTYDYYKNIIQDLGLEREFEDEFDADLGEFELEISESRVISRVLDAAPDDYILVVGERSPAYDVLRIPDEEQD